MTEPTQDDYTTHDEDDDPIALTGEAVADPELSEGDLFADEDGI